MLCTVQMAASPDLRNLGSTLRWLGVAITGRRIGGCLLGPRTALRTPNRRGPLRPFWNVQGQEVTRRHGILAADHNNTADQLIKSLGGFRINRSRP